MLVLKEKLQRVSRVFDIESIVQRETDITNIARYYKANRMAYRLFHNSEDFVHMGLSSGNKYKISDVYEQPKFVERYIDQLQAKKVLELATGKGASSYYLAKRYPQIQFYGIDLPNGQLDDAKIKAARVPNFFPIEGNYHDLSVFKDQTFDVVFVFEALCHSIDKIKVATEVYRVLSSGGFFIVVDGYLNKDFNLLSEDEYKAKKLTEKGMLVPDFESYTKVKNNIMSTGFKLEYEEDASQKIMPTLMRFENLSSLTIFNIPLFGRFITRVLKPEVAYNSVSGYLMPNLIQSGVAGYFISVFRKS